MLFLTELTPLMPRAISTALSMASFEVTNPLSCTTPLGFDVDFAGLDDDALDTLSSMVFSEKQILATDGH